MPNPATLVVRNHFGKYKRGDRIVDTTEIAKILAGHNRANVVAAKPSPHVPPLGKTAPKPPSAPAEAPAAS